MKISMSRNLLGKFGYLVLALVAWVPTVFALNTGADATTGQRPGMDGHRDPYVVIAFNDLGMHCMNEDFSELCILPPFNRFERRSFYVAKNLGSFEAAFQ